MDGTPNPATAAPPASPFTLSVADAVARVRRRDADLHAFLATRLDEALAEAAVRARERPRSVLHGVPYALKDQWDTAGIATTGGSYRHRHRVPAQSSLVHRVFDDAGAVLIGKTSLSDMGMAPEAANWLTGATRNPYAPARTAGGSSGGSAAAVADGMAAFDWATDIGGSIRLPAAFCGVFGLRLSSESWPITGMFPQAGPGFEWMCGQGPITRSLAEMRAVLDVAAPRLRTGRVRPFDLRGAVVYAPERFGAWPRFTDHVRGPLERALGDRIRAEALPTPTQARQAFAAVWATHFDEIVACDPSITLRDGVRAVVSAVLFRGLIGDRGFYPSTAELLGAIALGSLVLYRDRPAALRAAAAVRDGFAAAWDKGYVIVSPVCMYPPPRIGWTTRNLDLLSYTVQGNLADATALAVPFGHFANGLPRGVQLMGPPGSEATLIALAERLLAARAATPAAARVRASPRDGTAYGAASAL